jgi:hypothetical protein
VLGRRPVRAQEDMPLSAADLEAVAVE